MVNSIVLVLAFALFVFLAGVFAGSETGMYQLSRLRLRLGIEKKQLSFVILGKAMHDSSGLLLSMLIGTNLAHYLATSIITNMFLTKVGAEHTAELFTTILTAPVLFVFSELIPKNIFFYRADFLMPWLAPVLYVFHKVSSWCGAVPLLKFMSGIFARLSGTAIPSKTAITAEQRHYITAILADTREEGVLSSVQTDIVNRLVSISNIRIRAVMTPINKVAMVDLNSDSSALLNKLKKCAFSRLLVYERRPANIIGFVNIYEALCSPDRFADIRNLIKPIPELDANTTVIDTINTMQSENQKIVLVVRISHAGKERPIGIVTMKDLVEELLGELVEW